MTRPYTYLELIHRTKDSWTLRWSENNEAVERTAEDPKIGLTFAVREEIAQFIEGYASVRPLAPFQQILQFMSRFIDVHDVDGSEHPLHDLPEIFRKTGRRWRNAGVLCGLLSKRHAPPSDPADPVAVALELRRPAPLADREDSEYVSPIDGSVEVALFGILVNDWLENVPKDELGYWLRHGRAPRQASNGLSRKCLLARPRGRRPRYWKSWRSFPDWSGPRTC